MNKKSRLFSFFCKKTHLSSFRTKNGYLPRGQIAKRSIVRGQGSVAATAAATRGNTVTVVAEEREEDHGDDNEPQGAVIE